MSEKKVIFIDKNHPHLYEALQNLGFKCTEAYDWSLTRIENEIHEYQGLIIRSRFALNQSFLSKASKLEFIGRVGAGMENIDLDYAKSKGIALISAPEGNRTAVGEHAVGMLLSLMNKLKTADLEIRNGQWRREANRGHELSGKTVGIIGYGHMGRSFARKLQGFEVEVICHDILPGLGDQWATQVELEDLFQRADVLSLHTPQTPLTRGMVNRKFIEAFKKPFYLINTARGSAVRTEDLVWALEEGRILGACLDVLEFEKSSFEDFFDAGQSMPKAFQALISSDRVLLSPHVAGWTHASKFKLADTIVQKVRQLYTS